MFKMKFKIKCHSYIINGVKILSIILQNKIFENIIFEHWCPKRFWFCDTMKLFF